MNHEPTAYHHPVDIDRKDKGVSLSLVVVALGLSPFLVIGVVSLIAIFINH